jgi:hypothetical protein
MSLTLSNIAGNASASTKARVCEVVSSFCTGFGESIAERLTVVEVSMEQARNKEPDLRAKVVVETPVDQGAPDSCHVPPSLKLTVAVTTTDMLNLLASIHGGASAYLMGRQVLSRLLRTRALTACSCSALASVALDCELGGVGTFGASLSFDVTYYAPSHECVHRKVKMVRVVLNVSPEAVFCV